MSYDFKIEEYNPEWKEWFNQLRRYFEEQLNVLITRIEHVGSTAIPNMVAKPIVDMDIVIKEGCFNEIKVKLEEIGYIHQGDLGIEEREAFKLLNDELKQSLPPHHLYVCKQDSEELKRHIIFRDFLRKNPKEATNFSIMKRELYKKFSNDKDAYIEAKDSMVKKILKKALKEQVNI